MLCFLEACGCVRGMIKEEGVRKEAIWSCQMFDIFIAIGKVRKVRGRDKELRMGEGMQETDGQGGEDKRRAISSHLSSSEHEMIKKKNVSGGNVAGNDSQ